MNNNTRAIILAAGRGSRMKDKTESIPKCLIEVHGKTLLQRQIDSLSAAGIDQIGVVTGYRSELLGNYKLHEFHNKRWAETNMVSSLECADQWLQESVCVISYSDIFYDSSAAKSLLASNSSLAITYDPDWLELWKKRFSDPLSDAETLRMNPDGTLIEIGNKPSSLSEIEGQYMGLLRISPQAWNEIGRIRHALSPEQRDKMHMTGLLQKVIDDAKVPVTAIPYRGNWGEVDSPEDLRVYTRE